MLPTNQAGEAQSLLPNEEKHLILALLTALKAQHAAQIKLSTEDQFQTACRQLLNKFKSRQIKHPRI